MRWIYRITALGVLPFGIFSILEDFPGLWSGAREPVALTGVGALIGFAILLPGVLNLLNDSYGARAPGLRLATVVVNGLMALLFIRLETLNLSVEMFLLLPFLFVILFALSLASAMRGKGGEDG